MRARAASELRDRILTGRLAPGERIDLDEITDEFGTEDWDPLILQVNDDYARSLAAYRLADVLLVNPIRDGMNLVAKEGPLLSERGCALVLSREAGACAELGELSRSSFFPELVGESCPACSARI